MKGRFKAPDYKYDRQALLDHYFKTFLSDDAVRDEAEEATRETMFDRLIELAKVVTDVKKGLRKRK